MNERNERKNKITNFFTLKTVVQYNILTYWAYILSLQNDKKSRNRTKAKIACISPCKFKKKANSKMHALGRSVAIVFECGYVLAAHISVMYTLQLCLIGTNLKALAAFSWLFICYFVAIFNQGGTKYRPFF